MVSMVLIIGVLPVGITSIFITCIPPFCSQTCPCRFVRVECRCPPRDPLCGCRSSSDYFTYSVVIGSPVPGPLDTMPNPLILFPRGSSNEITYGNYRSGEVSPFLGAPAPFPKKNPPYLSVSPSPLPNLVKYPERIQPQSSYDPTPLQEQDNANHFFEEFFAPTLPAAISKGQASEMRDATRVRNTAITNENPEQESFISEISPGLGNYNYSEQVKIVRPRSREATVLDQDGCRVENSYRCCDDILETTILDSLEQLSLMKDFNECNIDRIAKVIQTASQRQFNKTFEVIVGLKDFVSRTFYAGKLTCKIRSNDLYVLSYATPQQYGTITDAAVTHNNGSEVPFAKSMNNDEDQFQSRRSVLRVFRSGTAKRT